MIWFRSYQSKLVQHAKTELALAGVDRPDSDYNGMLAKAVTELVTVFSKQGHSGFSAGLTVRMFQKVALFEPLTPLTGADEEWVEVGTGVFQNKRCSHVFKENGKAYDIEGRIFREPGGASYTSQDSRLPVIFPYSPLSEIVDVPMPP